MRGKKLEKRSLWVKIWLSPKVAKLELKLNLLTFKCGILFFVSDQVSFK